MTDAQAAAHDDTSAAPVSRLPSPASVASIILLVAAACMVAESLAKPLWLDELLTWATASLPSPGLIWRSLAIAPLSLDPPLYHWLMHYVMRIFGESGISMRLISMSGFLAASWLVYVFAARAHDRFAGLLAMSFLTASGAFRWSYEARPYGLVLAAAAGALVAWQNIARDRSRGSSLFLFALCLAVADSSHYYSILICIPFVASELVRARRRRAIDWPVAAAIVAGNAVMLAFLPLIPATKAYQSTYFRSVHSGDVLEAYRTFLGSSPAQAALLIALLIALSGRYWRRAAGDGSERSRMLPEEIAVLVSFSLYPLAVFVLSVLVTHTDGERFALPGILGLSLLAALLFRKIQSSDTLALVATGVILCAPPVHAAHSLETGRGKQTRAYTRQADVFSGAPGARIVMTDVGLYLATLKYGPADLRQRISMIDFAASPTASDRHNTGQMMVLGVRAGVGLPVTTLAELGGIQDPFFIVCQCSEATALSLTRHAVPADAGRFLDSAVFRLQPVPGR